MLTQFEIREDFNREIRRSGGFVFKTKSLDLLTSCALTLLVSYTMKFSGSTPYAAGSRGATTVGGGRPCAMLSNRFRS